MQQPSLSTIVDTVVNEDGVSNITVGNIVGYQILRSAVEMLKMNDDQADYEQYKAIKFPNNKATAESRRDAYKFAMGRVSELAVASYNRNLTDDDNVGTGE